MPPLRITSAANPRFKDAMRLREGRYRRRAGLFLVDGRRETARAVQAGCSLQTLFLSESNAPEDWPTLLQLATSAPPRDSPSSHASAVPPGVETGRAMTPDEETGRAVSPGVGRGGEGGAGHVVELTAPLFQRLAYGGRDEGIVGVFRTPDRSLAQFRPPASPLLVVLDRIEKPGNIGAVFRSADAAGADGIVLSDCGTDLFNPNTIRASAATIFSLPSAVATGIEVRNWLAAHSIRTVATRVDAIKNHWECDWRGGVAILIGNEAEGLGEGWSASEAEGVRIPMAGVADSLNASVTAAICLYEAVRQRSA